MEIHWYDEVNSCRMNRSMLYFSYGSNMSSKRLIARVATAQAICKASLLRHTLKFHKEGMDGSAKCDASQTDNQDDRVLGVVFDIAPRDKTFLDRCEGKGNGYEIKTVELISDDGETIEAFTYYATSIDADLQPYHWYKEHVLRGALENGLPDVYVRLIREVQSVDDPDPVRHGRELSIYR